MHDRELPAAYGGQCRSKAPPMQLHPGHYIRVISGLLIPQPERPFGTAPRRHEDRGHRRQGNAQQRNAQKRPLVRSMVSFHPFLRTAMSRKKLPLSVEERLTWRAKAPAAKRGTSVSRLVETFFTALGEEGGALEEENAQESGPTSSPTGGDSSELSSSPPTRYRPADYRPSDWARRWRGAFANEGATDSDDSSCPEDVSWEEKVLAEEIEKKHSRL